MENKHISKKINIELFDEDIKKLVKIKNPNFLVDKFEELLIRDIFEHDENTRIKLSRDVSKMFNEWIEDKLEKKENIPLNAKGDTRSGKSLAMLKIGEKIVTYYNKEFNTERIVCANQKEYRLKLQDATFGDYFQVDENAFANSGEGSMLEQHQLKDIQNIIAKQNIHVSYLTPKIFLGKNALLGLHAWGKDTKNWLSRFLLYSLKGGVPQLIGYVVINVGSLFYDYGCFMYKYNGGCTNPERLKFDKTTKDFHIFSKMNEKDEELKKVNIPKKIIDSMTCINEKDKKDIKKAQEKVIESNNPCPFYNSCFHPLCHYEHKKDKWIEKEMRGGFDERTKERFETAIKLIQKLGVFDAENMKLKIYANNGKDMEIKVKLYINNITSTKFTITELQEIIQMIKSLCSLEVMIITLSQIYEDLEKEEKIKKIQDELLKIPEMDLFEKLNVYIKEVLKSQ
jgi:hypothetical protein